MIQIAHQPLHARVARVVQQMPVQTLVVVPFAHLGKLAAHEEQLFARMAPHKTEVSAQVGKLLPHVAGHFGQQRAFAVNHLVVRNRQHKIFAEGVAQAEGQLALVVLAVRRVAGHELQRVVHPAHVPFVIKAQPARRRRVRDKGKGGRFLGQRDRLRALLADDVVHAL